MTGSRPGADGAGAIGVVILAAGAGRRLAAANGGRPKWLTDVGGRSIADRQLAALELALGAGDCVVVVSGHRHADVKGWLTERASPLAIRVIDNDRYRERNNWYSLLLGLQYLEGEDWAGTVVVLNSDLCAPEDWFGPFLRAVRADRPEPGLVAVDEHRPLTEEAMKVSVRATAGGGLLCRRIGKVGVDDPAGEYVGIASLCQSTWELLASILEGYLHRPELADAWYESGFQELMDRSLLAPWSVPDSGWAEIDDDVDLASAEVLVGAPSPGPTCAR